MPDYITFCTDCHNATNTIYSTTLGRDLIKIDWSAGDNHGGYHAISYLTNSATGGTRDLQAPYLTAGSQNTTNYVLSCLDCHEPHGSPNITLLRREVNGGDLVGAITTLINPPGTGANDSNKELGYLCERCHNPDDPTADPPTWFDVHHVVSGHPYTARQCRTCHGSPWPIACDKCHFHGGTDAWLVSGSTLKTF